MHFYSLVVSKVVTCIYIYIYMHIFLRICRLFLNLDTNKISCLVYLNFFDKIIIKSKNNHFWTLINFILSLYNASKPHLYYKLLCSNNYRNRSLLWLYCRETKTNAVREHNKQGNSTATAKKWWNYECSAIGKQLIALLTKDISLTPYIQIDKKPLPP